MAMHAKMMFRESPIAGRANFKSPLVPGEKDNKDFCDGKVFEFYLQTRDYLPEHLEFKVQNEGRVIRIEGRHKTERKARSFFHELILPEGINAKAIEYTMNEKAVLRIRAPIGDNVLPELPDESVPST